jgi:DNA-binding transcriptional ArsR family regulator
MQSGNPGGFDKVWSEVEDNRGVRLFNSQQAVYNIISSKNQGMQNEELLIETLSIKKAALSFRALNNKLRMQILQLIDKKGRITVSAIYKKMKMEQSVASQHLGILRNEGIVKTERESKFIFYSINYQRIKELEAFAGQLLKFEVQPPARSPKKPKPEIVNEQAQIIWPKWLDAIRKMVDEEQSGKT